MCSTAAARPLPDAPSQPPRHRACCGHFLSLGVRQGHFHEPPKGSRASPSLAATGCQLQRSGLCWLAAPHCHPSWLLSFLWACPVLNLNPLHLNSGDSAPTSKGRIHTHWPRNKRLYSHTCWALPSQVPNPRQGCAGHFVTGHLEKSVTGSARVRIWEGSAFQSPRHPRRQARRPALKA